MPDTEIKNTPLTPAHTDAKAKMAEFAGYNMPIQYPEGVLNEHSWVRDQAGIFDVSHMGQLSFKGPNIETFLEKVTPSSYGAMKIGGCKYSVLTNNEGGIVDDLIITKFADDEFRAVVNGACKIKDIDWLKQFLPIDIEMTHHDDRALIALQGPLSEQILRDTLGIDTSAMNYMTYLEHKDYGIYRLGYTGEDGFEISIANDQAMKVWTLLDQHDAVKPIGLAARDSLRLEMGYPLYGHDIDATTSPVEANVTWVMGKQANRDFIGNQRVLDELDNGASKIRIGFELVDKGVAREGSEIFSADGSTQIGVITSGTFSPTLQKAIGMAYIETPHAQIDNTVIVRVRGRDIAAKLSAYPFVQPKTKTTLRKAA